jgi:hypothetical protein
MAVFGEWELSCDHQATADAYASATRGDSERCSFNGCRNCVAARSQVSPKAFIEFSDGLGIDSRNDGEIYHNPIYHRDVKAAHRH